MTIERTRVIAQPKPWGVTDLRPWSAAGHDGALIGELSYQRTDESGPPPALLLKLLFTSAPLSIQVHPDDAYAKTIGLPNGKNEAWYVLSAAPDAMISIGLKRSVTSQQLKRAIDDGSIVELVNSRTVKADDVVAVPAGTIHAIGAGIVLAEIQQRSDATFRLFDHGRVRPLNVSDGVAVAHLGPCEPQRQPKRMTGQRRLLVSNSNFVFERIELAPGSRWRLNAERETWLLTLGGSVCAGSLNLVRGEAAFLQSEMIAVQAGRMGAECLVAYVGSDGVVQNLLLPIVPQVQSKLAATATRKRTIAHPGVQL